MRVVWPSLFICNLILMHFFKVISFYLEISYMIIQCLRTVTLVDICSDLVCLQSQWFSTDVLWNFSGNGRRRRPFSVSCNNVFLQVSLWWSPVALKLKSYCLQLCKKNCCKLVFWVFPEQILFRGVFKPIRHSRWSLLQK